MATATSDWLRCLLSDLAELEPMDEKTGEETDMRLVFCQRPSQLKEELAEKP